MSSSLLPAGFDFANLDLFADRIPEEEFALLRENAPVWWNAEPYNEVGYYDSGFWVVTRHEDVKTISKDSKLFSSWEKTAMLRADANLADQRLEAERLIMLNKDAPEHTKLRRIVSRGFTPRAINRLEETLRRRAEQIVEEAKENGSGDFVVDVASELPLQAIAELLGVPQEDRRKLFDWSNQMVGMDDPEFEVDPGTASMELIGYAWNMAEERKKCPMGDIVTNLIEADVDGEALGSDEFGFFVILLAVAGNETTRNAITHGMKAFLDHPDQWERFKQERPKSAADEIVRWATPVVAFQRTATADTELGGQHIREGDRLAMYYSSANFDPEVFDEPQKFDIMRDPNPHVGFGGTGAHYCLGANLALLEIDLMFNAIADAMPNIREVSPPDRMRSNWLNGVKHYQVAYE